MKRSPDSERQQSNTLPHFVTDM